MSNVRRQLYRLLEPSQHEDVRLHAVDVFVVTNIIVSLSSYILGTVPWIRASYNDSLVVVDHFTSLVFGVEYGLRVWTSIENPRYHGAFVGRLKYMRSGMAIIDLLAFAPFILELMDLRAARILRVLRLIRAFKAARYMKSMRLITDIVYERRFELTSSLTFMAFLLVVSSALMFEVENRVQPEQFSSIPATMWWGVASLTTMGYGDIYPISTLGKFLAGCIAVVGIGLFAIPTGILAAAFVEKLSISRQNSHSRHSSTPTDET